MSVEDSIINMLENIVSGYKLRKRGFKPMVSDSEIITMQVTAEFLGIDTDKGVWEYFSQHWKYWFPMLGSRANYAKHTANVWQVTQQLQKELAKKLGTFTLRFSITCERPTRRYACPEPLILLGFYKTGLDVR